MGEHDDEDADSTSAPRTIVPLIAVPGSPGSDPADPCMGNVPDGLGCCGVSASQVERISGEDMLRTTIFPGYVKKAPRPMRAPCARIRDKL